MKTRHSLMAAGTVVLTALPGAGFDSDWSTLDGGGGTSAGGRYELSGTIGQPDLGTASGGRYSLQGGFWSILGMVQTPGAPLLSIARTPGGIEVSWPQGDPGWTLQYSTDLGRDGGHWVDVPPPYVIKGGRQLFLESLPAGRKFFRLHRPPP